MKLEVMAVVLHPEYLRVALMVALLSVWVLVGLFFCLYRYIRRDHFALWSVAWLFYALWLTLSMRMGDPGVGSITFTIKQCLLSLSAVMLLWGSLRFLELPVSQRLIAGFGVFLMVWIFLSTQVMLSVLLVELPVFMLLGLGSPFAGLCYLRLRRHRSLVGAGMLSLGFLLWGIYLGSYPFANQYGRLYSAGFLGAAVLQFVVAAGMIALVLEEIRSNAERGRPDSGAGRPRKDSSQLEIITAREEGPSLPDHVHWKEGTRRVHQELRRTEQALVQQERLLALGQMVNGVAHDINCALSPLTAYSELLLSTLPDLADAPPQRLEKISEAAEDVARIVARLRELYRRDLDPEQLEKGNESIRLGWPVLAAHPATSLQTKFERLLLECSGDFALAQPEGISPVRWFSLKKGRPRTA
jgi:signal transduction histidine kinase